MRFIVIVCSGVSFLQCSTFIPALHSFPLSRSLSVLLFSFHLRFCNIIITINVSFFPPSFPLSLFIPYVLPFLPSLPYPQSFSLRGSANMRLILPRPCRTFPPSHISLWHQSCPAVVPLVCYCITRSLPRRHTGVTQPAPARCSWLAYSVHRTL